MAGWLHEFRLRIKALFSKRRLDREMAEELEFHQMMLREKLARDSGEAASLDADVRHTFGDARRWHERLTELWQFRWLESLRRDAVFGVRLLRKSPGFTTIALLTLMLGIGANAAVFSLINGLLLRPLPVPHSEELMLLNWDQGSVGSAFCVPVFRAIERHADLFDHVFAFGGQDFHARNGNKNETFSGELVSGQFFEGLQTQPQMGRGLTPADDKPGSVPVVVISNAFWRNWFNSAPDVIGRKLILDDVSFTVVGVMPKSFIGMDTVDRPQMYVPLALEPLVDAPFDKTSAGYHMWWLRVGARRKAGTTLAQLQPMLHAISGPLIRASVPATLRVNNVPADKMILRAEPGSTGYSYLKQQFHDPLMVNFALCGAVLLLACLNLTSLLMARAAAREREMATRLAIGASRRRVMQQLLVESMLLAFTGTLLGFALAPFAARSLAMLMMKSNAWVNVDSFLDFHTLLFCGGIAVVCTVIIGLVPALQASSGSLQDQTRQGTHHLRATLRQHLLGRVFLAAEVALALIVVTGAGLLGASLLRLYRVGLGFQAHGVELVNMDLNKQHLKGANLLQFYREFADQVSHVPGVSDMSYADITPLSNNYYWDDSWNVNGKKGTVFSSTIAPNYFHVLSIPIRAGRDFAWTDTAGSTQVVILNEIAAKYFFPKGNAIGQQIRVGDENVKTYEVIAVVGNTKYMSQSESLKPIAYLALAQAKLDTPGYTVVLRTHGMPRPIVDAVRNIAGRLVPLAPAPSVTTLEEQVNERIATQRIMAMLSVFFAACALLVTGIGLYGTLAYTTARRTSEIGIRMALGAQRGQVALLVFRENAMVALTGSLAGLVLALLTSHALSKLLYDTSAHDVGVLLLSVAAMGVIACVASLLPALRASRIEPMHAIRHE